MSLSRKDTVSSNTDRILSFFAGGLSALTDSQLGSSGVNDPTPYTQDGPQGQSQVTSYAEVLQSPLVIAGGVLVVVLLVAVVLKK